MCSLFSPKILEIIFSISGLFPAFSSRFSEKSRDEVSRSALMTSSCLESWAKTPKTAGKRLPKAFETFDSLSPN